MVVNGMRLIRRGFWFNCRCGKFKEADLLNTHLKAILSLSVQRLSYGLDDREIPLDCQ
jgi:hypothetical protein